MEIVNKITDTVKKPAKLLKWVLITGIIVLVIWGGYRLYLKLAYKVDMPTIKADIANETSDANIQKLLLEGVNAIINDPAKMQEAITYCKASGDDINTTLVNDSIAAAKQNGYVA